MRVLLSKTTAVLLSIGGVSQISMAQTVAEQHIELKATIEQWMETMERTQELERRWMNDEDVLKDTISGLKGMIEQSEADIAEVEKRLDSADLEAKEKLEQQKDYNQAREVMRAGLGPVEAEVAKVVPLFPDFYLNGEEGSSKLKAAVEALQEHRTAEPDEKEKLGLNARLQPLVQILTEAERFHSKIFAVAHGLEVGGVEKQMNVLYFGLSKAYAVDDAGTVALRGTSTLEGWKFEALSGEEIAQKVKRLYQAADGSGESEMVKLPLQIN